MISDRPSVGGETANAMLSLGAFVLLVFVLFVLDRTW